MNEHFAPILDSDIFAGFRERSFGLQQHAIAEVYNQRFLPRFPLVRHPLRLGDKDLAI